MLATNTPPPASAKGGAFPARNTPATEESAARTQTGAGARRRGCGPRGDPGWGPGQRTGVQAPRGCTRFPGETQPLEGSHPPIRSPGWGQGLAHQPGTGGNGRPARCPPVRCVGGEGHFPVETELHARRVPSTSFLYASPGLPRGLRTTPWGALGTRLGVRRGQTPALLADRGLRSRED